MAHAARSRVLASIAANMARLRRTQATLCGAPGRAARGRAGPRPRRCAARARLCAVFRKARRQGRATSYERAYAAGKGNADIVLLYALYCSRAGLPTGACRDRARAGARSDQCPGASRGGIDRLCRAAAMRKRCRRSAALSSSIPRSAMRMPCRPLPDAVGEAQGGPHRIRAEPTRFLPPVAAWRSSSRSSAISAAAERPMRTKSPRRWATPRSTSRPRCWRNGGGRRSGRPAGAGTPGLATRA